MVTLHFAHYHQALSPCSEKVGKSAHFIFSNLLFFPNPLLLPALFLSWKMWEVVYPTSRAVELGAEDDEEEKCIFQNHFTTPIVRMSNELQNKDKTVFCKLLVLAFDRIPTTFIEAHFINNESQIVGLVSSGNIKEGDVVANSLQQTAISDKTCFIHSANGSNEVLFCQSKVDVPTEACHNWANEVSIEYCAGAFKVITCVCSINIYYTLLFFCRYCHVSKQRKFSFYQHYQPPFVQ